MHLHNSFRAWHSGTYQAWRLRQDDPFGPEVPGQPGSEIYEIYVVFFKKEKRKRKEDKIALKPSWHQHISVTFSVFTSINTQKALESMFQIGIIPNGTQSHGS